MPLYLLLAALMATPAAAAAVGPRGAEQWYSSASKDKDSRKIELAQITADETMKKGGGGNIDTGSADTPGTISTAPINISIEDAFDTPVTEGGESAPPTLPQFGPVNAPGSGNARASVRLYSAASVVDGQLDAASAQYDVATTVTQSQLAAGVSATLVSYDFY